MVGCTCQTWREYENDSDSGEAYGMIAEAVGGYPDQMIRTPIA